MTEGKIRKSNIELLRIIAMLMIVTSHYCVHGNQFCNAFKMNFDGIFIHSGILGNLGVDIFFMISGYFLSKSQKPFKLHKALSLIFQVWLYSTSIALFLTLVFKLDIGKANLIKALFPTTFYEYSFFTVYLLIYALSPFLNLVINNISKKEYLVLIAAFLLFVSLPETLLGRMYLDSYVIDGITCYFIGGGITYLKLPSRKWRNLLIIAVSWIALGIVDSFLHNMSSQFDGIHFYSRIAIPTLLIAATLLSWFESANIKQNECINFFAKHTFGIFLIHDNNYVRDLLWKRLLDNSNYHGLILVVDCLICVVLVFVCCALLDVIRSLVQDKLEKLITWGYRKLRLPIIEL